MEFASNECFHNPDIEVAHASLMTRLRQFIAQHGPPRHAIADKLINHVADHIVALALQASELSVGVTVPNSFLGEAQFPIPGSAGRDSGAAPSPVHRGNRSSSESSSTPPGRALHHRASMPSASRYSIVDGCLQEDESASDPDPNDNIIHRPPSPSSPMPRPFHGPPLINVPRAMPSRPSLYAAPLQCKVWCAHVNRIVVWYSYTLCISICDILFITHYIYSSDVRCA